MDQIVSSASGLCLSWDWTQLQRLESLAARDHESTIDPAFNILHSFQTVAASSPPAPLYTPSCHYAWSTSDHHASQNINNGFPSEAPCAAWPQIHSSIDSLHPLLPTSLQTVPLVGDDRYIEYEQRNHSQQLPMATCTDPRVTGYDSTSKRSVSSPPSDLRLPAYEVLIAKALAVLNDPRGVPPRTIFDWMAKEYPKLPKGFRGSATQALKKALHRKRVIRTKRGGYIANQVYESKPVYGRIKKGGLLASSTLNLPSTIVESSSLNLAAKPKRQNRIHTYSTQIKVSTSSNQTATTINGTPPTPLISSTDRYDIAPQLFIPGKSAAWSMAYTPNQSISPSWFSDGHQLDTATYGMESTFNAQALSTPPTLKRDLFATTAVSRFQNHLPMSDHHDLDTLFTTPPLTALPPFVIRSDISSISTIDKCNRMTPTQQSTKLIGTRYIQPMSYLPNELSETGDQSIPYLHSAYSNPTSQSFHIDAQPIQRTHILPNSMFLSSDTHLNTSSQLFTDLSLSSAFINTTPPLLPIGYPAMYACGNLFSEYAYEQHREPSARLDGFDLYSQLKNFEDLLATATTTTTTASSTYNTLQ